MDAKDIVVTDRSRRFVRVLRGPRGRWLAAGLALFAPIALWFLGWIAIGDRWLPIRWGAYGAPWLALLLFVAAVFFGLARRLWVTAAAAILAFLILAPVLPRFAPSRWFGEHGPADLAVMTFNASALNGNDAVIARFIIDTKPDIVFLQQAHDIAGLKRALAIMPGVPHYQSVPEGGSDVIILSRFPLSGVRREALTTAVARIGGCYFRLWDLHAPHGQLSYRDQRDFFRDVASQMADETLPILLGGDFNSTEFNSVQAPLRARLSDAYDDAGAGLGFTFPSHVRRFGLFGKLFRIDHIFYSRSPDLVAVDARVADNAGSDHFAVLARFRLAPRCRPSAGR